MSGTSSNRGDDDPGPMSLLGDVIDQLHQPGFSAALAAWLRSSVDFDHVVIFGYHGESAPLDLHDDFPSSKRRIFVTRYQEGHYLLDPFYLACTHGVTDGLYRLKELAPDRFYQSEYFRSYYVQTGLAEEIGFFIGLPGNVRIVISLMRASAAGTFGTRELRLLRRLVPIVRAAATQHWRELDRRFVPSTDNTERPVIQQAIDHAFRTFGRSLLTPRERMVVEYVLRATRPKPSRRPWRSLWARCASIARTSTPSCASIRKASCSYASSTRWADRRRRPAPQSGRAARASADPGFASQTLARLRPRACPTCTIGS